jgi:hypothetical protein
VRPESKGDLLGPAELAREPCYLDVCDLNIDIWKQLIYHKNKWMSKTLKSAIEYIKTHEFQS